MGHRKSDTSETSDMDHAQMWNGPHPDLRLYFENASIVASSSNVAVNGVNSVACLNNGLRLDAHPSSSLNAELPNHRAVSGTLHNAFLHPASGSSSSQIPPHYTQHVPPCYNLPPINDDGGRVNPPTDAHRLAHKRIAPAMPLVFDRGNSNGYYGAGSSSNHPMPSDHFWSESMTQPQCWHTDSSNLVPGYSSDNLSNAPEGSQRNVRIRHSYEIHPPMSSPLNHLPLNITPMGNTYNPGIAMQSSYAPVSMASDRRIQSSDVSHAGSGVSNGNGAAESNGGYQPNIIQNRNPTAPVAAVRVPLRAFPYRANASHSAIGLASSSPEARFSGFEPVASSRHPRPSSTIRHSSGRSGRARSSSSRSLLLDVENAHSRWIQGGFMMIDQSAIYDIRNLSDQHRDLRLDVDNMSYEELLALGDRMGSVSTGLSEDAVRRCLKEAMYYSSDLAHKDLEDRRCVICLEEYMDKVMVGRLRCRHGFHVDCIKKWLSIKSVCPICKAAAIAETSVGKSKISS